MGWHFEEAVYQFLPADIKQAARAIVLVVAHALKDENYNNHQKRISHNHLMKALGNADVKTVKEALRKLAKANILVPLEKGSDKKTGSEPILYELRLEKAYALLDPHSTRPWHRISAWYGHRLCGEEYNMQYAPEGLKVGDALEPIETSDKGQTGEIPDQQGEIPVESGKIPVESGKTPPYQHSTSKEEDREEDGFIAEKRRMAEDEYHAPKGFYDAVITAENADHIPAMIKKCSDYIASKVGTKDAITHPFKYFHGFVIKETKRGTFKPTASQTTYGEMQQPDSIEVVFNEFCTQFNYTGNQREQLMGLFKANFVDRDSFITFGKRMIATYNEANLSSEQLFAQIEQELTANPLTKA